MPKTLGSKQDGSSGKWQTAHEKSLIMHQYLHRETYL
jgi:hypothetical protein